ncbi:AbrB/MazE/SpoVT family DNA-binding domain-containing protein [Patescibacteria group bacterium]|nr:AbrB/MazE/SpoVT family DNA-binding domain-containing protein [Patescibacteria group bacterium]MBU1124327.1 AbrB/MazE/SpoVT family DNA-binding domain-containing protein [Patescibacteria group bacterium]MBU1911035.1 AbrB/MazE/SpoVT family DNA-binding domain-containing protein [Patescibacteria group bacterium]
MISETLNLWDNGAVTLPKEWREKYGTKHFLAKENSKGYLVIMPILDVEYYEDDDGSFGLRFPTGIEMGELIKLWEEGMEEAKKIRKKKPKKSQKK